MYSKRNSSALRIRKLVTIAMLCALAYVATLVFHFKVGFLTFDVKDAIIALCSLLYGPIYGASSAVLVALLEFISISDTGVYGLVMNVLSSASFAVTVGLIYKYKRSFCGAILGVCSAVVAMTAVMLLANYFITPYYMGVDRSVVVDLLPKLLLPFNLCKGVLNAAIMLLLYKPITTALRRVGFLPKGSGEYRFDLRSILLIVFSVVAFVSALLFLFLYLGGSIEFFTSFT